MPRVGGRIQPPVPKQLKPITQGQLDRAQAVADAARREVKKNPTDQSARAQFNAANACLNELRRHPISQPTSAPRAAAPAPAQTAEDKSEEGFEELEIKVNRRKIKEVARQFEPVDVPAPAKEADSDWDDAEILVEGRETTALAPTAAPEVTTAPAAQQSASVARSRFNPLYWMGL